MVWEVIWVLATFAVVLPSIHYLTRGFAMALCNDLTINIVSEKPTDGIELQFTFLFLHFRPPVLVV
jgi:hypothetical protein